MDRCLETKRIQVLEEEMIGRDNKKHYYVRFYGPLLDAAGEPTQIIAYGLDITERKLAEEDRLKMETKMLQAQKLESLGVLAGGIAHDFNNLLMGVMGNVSLAQLDCSINSQMNEYLESINVAAQRASDLTRQMLAYSGKGRFVVEVLDLNSVIDEMAHLLEITISKKIQLEYKFSDVKPRIEADSTQLRQIVMNLITNASEAIADQNGAITIETGECFAKKEFLRDFFPQDELPEGEYSWFSVKDCGCGMSYETQAKIFDPFFTTKFTGRGLGLAAVLGIVRGHEGGLKVRSKKGEGSQFTVLLPKSTKPLSVGINIHSTNEGWRGEGKILVVDDEKPVREVVQRTFEKCGFEVYSAEDGLQAVEIFEQMCHQIKLVVLDMTMPNMDGNETFAALRKIRPDIPVILSSGYTEQDTMENFDGDLAGFIQKPYRTSALIAKVQQILDVKVGV